MESLLQGDRNNDSYKTATATAWTRSVRVCAHLTRTRVKLFSLSLSLYGSKFIPFRNLISVMCSPPPPLLSSLARRWILHFLKPLPNCLFITESDDARAERERVCMKAGAFSKMGTPTCLKRKAFAFKTTIVRQKEK